MWSLGLWAFGAPQDGIPTATACSQGVSAAPPEGAREQRCRRVGRMPGAKERKEHPIVRIVDADLFCEAASSSATAPLVLPENARATAGVRRIFTRSNASSAT